MIAAIYLPKNSVPHLFGDNHESITLNLGGKYFYELGEIEKNTEIINKVANNSYLEGFWPKNISLLSVIVGANGTGKSTILQIIKTGCQLVIEKEESTDIVWTDNVGQFFYYTPYLAENRSNEDRANVCNVSKLSQMIKDSRFENLDFSGHWEIYKSERLTRIISLIDEEKYKTVFDELKITKFNKINIQFLKINKDNWNVSRNLRPFFDKLDNLIKTERTQKEQELIDKHELSTPEEIDNNDEYQKQSKQLRLKLNILECIISKVHSILESTGNKFLEEGFVKNDLSVSSIKFKEIKSAKQAFFKFIENTFFELKSNKYFLPVEEIKHLTNTLLENINDNNPIQNWAILKVDFSNTKTIIESYQHFLLSFKDVFVYDETVFMIFSPDKTLSTGEYSFYELFSSLNYYNYRINNRLDVARLEDYEDYDNYIILLDEADLGFHPFWKRKYIKYLVNIIPKIFQEKNLQLIISTHDPLTLSDIPNNNIIYLRKDDSIVRELGIGDTQRPRNSFAANITDLLADSFFVNDGLLGEFAKEKIEETINWINNNQKKIDENDHFKVNIDDYKKHEKIIKIIDEPVLQVKLNEMLLSLKTDNDISRIDSIDEQIRQLEKEKEQLRKNSDDIS